MGDASRPRPSLVPIVWALGWLVALGSALYAVPWPFVDVHTTLLEATYYTWPDTIRLAFGPDAEYRPLFKLAVKASYQLFGLQLWRYQTLVLVQLAAILGLIIWLVRPVGNRRAVAACVALSCILGLHTSRILFGFWPVNFGSLVLALLLAAAVVAVDGQPRFKGWAFFLIVLVAMLSLEWGVMIVAVLLALWMVNAPGVDRRAAMGAVAGAAAYVGIRLLFGPIGRLPIFHTESGFLFAPLSPAELEARFGQAPWEFWLYNVASTLLTVVASEPREGVWAFTAALLEGNVPYFQWVHVGSSLLTTGVIAAGLMTGPRLSERDRLLATTALVLLVVASALGLPYTRDRVGLMAGVGYGLLVFVSVSRLLEAAQGLRRQHWATACVVALVGALWIVRSAETYAQVRDTAWDFHHEWIERAAEFDAIGGRDVVLNGMRSAALSRTPDDPRLDPTWSQVLFERHFPVTASRPLSPRFDVRWKPEVTDRVRLRLEQELGLTDAERVERDPRQRTWSYRLRRPTHARIEAVLMHESVEDTARIDAERLEIPQ
jgi:hypothetical protein